MIDRLAVFKHLNTISRERDPRVDEGGYLTSFQRLCHDLKETGWVYLASGSFKNTYGHVDADFVIKVEKYDQGANEMDNALNAPFPLAHFLAPVWQGNGFQIQDRLILNKCTDPEACRELLHDCADSGISYKHPINGEIIGNPHNHTHDETGLIILYDYGQDGQWFTPPAARRTARYNPLPVNREPVDWIGASKPSL